MRDVTAVVVDNVAKTYETRNGTVEALRRVDLEVPEGQFVALVGPSGCGKSTLLHIIAGLTSNSSGSVLVNGTPAAAGRKDIGIMLQSPVLFPWKTVLENVLMPADIRKVDPAEARERAHELLALTGIEEFAQKHIWELSGGMRQRASLAQVLVTDPPILLMDEPFSAVDEFTRERLNVELIRIHEMMKRTTIFVTHNIREAVFLADRVVVMKPRPGEVIDVVDIPLDHPREASMIEDDITAHLVTDIRHRLSAHV